MGILISLLVAVQIIVCFLLVVIVLMQRPKQEGLGAAFGGGMTDQVFGAQTTDVLQKGTVWLTVTFFVVSMVLAILIANRNEAAAELTESLNTGAPAAPVEETTEGLPSLPKPEQGLTPAVPVENDAKAATGAPKSEAKKDANAEQPKGGAAKAKEKAAAGSGGAKKGGKAKNEAKAKADSGAKAAGDAAKGAAEGAKAKAKAEAPAAP